MTQTTTRPVRRTSTPVIVALVLGLIITVAVGLALVAARNSPDEPTWEWLGEERQCSQIYMDAMTSDVIFNEWRNQCGEAWPPNARSIGPTG